MGKKLIDMFPKFCSKFSKPFSHVVKNLHYLHLSFKSCVVDNSDSCEQCPELNEKPTGLSSDRGVAVTNILLFYASFLFVFFLSPLCSCIV